MPKRFAKRKHKKQKRPPLRSGQLRDGQCQIRRFYYTASERMAQMNLLRIIKLLIAGGLMLVAILKGNLYALGIIATALVVCRILDEE